jgi:hypothetical protein
LNFIPSRTGFRVAVEFFQFPVEQGFFVRSCAAVKQVAFFHFAKFVEDFPSVGGRKFREFRENFHFAHGSNL